VWMFSVNLNISQYLEQHNGMLYCTVPFPSSEQGKKSETPVLQNFLEVRGSRKGVRGVRKSRFFPLPSVTSQDNTTGRFTSLSDLFDWFNKKKEEKSIESYSITQTTLEQIFIQIAGDEEDTNTDENKTK